MDEAWERAVELACAGQDPQTVRSLTLDGSVKCSQGRLPARALLERYPQLRVLSIANVGLTSLADFPSLKHLERLNLSDNRISGGLEFLVDAGLQSLRDLDLSNNKIQQLDDLAPLAQLNLLSLDLYECPITRLQVYRPRVFSLIKSLQYLDKVDAEDNERPESDEEEDDVDDDGVDDEDAAVPRSNGFVDQEDDDGEDSDELDEEDDENAHYRSANHAGQSNEESGTEEEDIDDEEDTEQVLEVEESEDEEAVEEEEDVDDEDDDDDATEGTNTAVDGEIDAQDEGEDDNSELGDEDDEGDDGVDDDDGDEEDEEEDLGTEYLVQPIARAEDEEGASDFEPGEDEYADDDEDVDEDDEDDAEAAAAALKRKRGQAKDDDDEGTDDEGRPSKK